MFTILILLRLLHIQPVTSGGSQLLCPIICPVFCPTQTFCQNSCQTFCEIMPSSACHKAKIHFFVIFFPFRECKYRRKSACVTVFWFGSDNQLTSSQCKFQLFTLFSGRHVGGLRLYNFARNISMNISTLGQQTHTELSLSSIMSQFLDFIHCTYPITVFFHFLLFKVVHVTLGFWKTCSTHLSQETSAASSLWWLNSPFICLQWRIGSTV